MESDNGGRVFIDDNRSSRGSKTGSENGRKDEVREETISQHSNANEGRTGVEYQLLATNDLLEKVLKDLQMMTTNDDLTNEVINLRQEVSSLGHRAQQESFFSQSER